MKSFAAIFDVYGTLLMVGPPPPDADARWHHLFRDLLGTAPALSRLEFSIATNKVIARQHEEAHARGIAWPEVHWPSVASEVLPALTKLSTQVLDEFLFRQIQTGHTIRMTSETAAALRWFKERSFVLGIASNAQAYTLRELSEAMAVHALGLELFERDLCFWSFEQGFSKPDPHVFQVLSARLTARGLGPQKALMVGDREDNDLAPARAFGWRAWQICAHSGEDGGEFGDWNQLIRRLRDQK